MKTKSEEAATRSLDEVRTFVSFLASRTGRAPQLELGLELTPATRLNQFDFDSLEILQVVITLEMIRPAIELEVDSLEEAVNLSLAQILDLTFGKDAPLPRFVTNH